MHIHELGGELTAPFSMSPALQERQAPVWGTFGGRGLRDPAAVQSLGGR